MKKLYLLTVVFVSMVMSLHGQKTISGKILDISGEPLIGVNIMEEGTVMGQLQILMVAIL